MDIFTFRYSTWLSSLQTVDFRVRMLLLAVTQIQKLQDRPSLYQLAEVVPALNWVAKSLDFRRLARSCL